VLVYDLTSFSVHIEAEQACSVLRLLTVQEAAIADDCAKGTKKYLLSFLFM
jgi:hypothetical protein